MYAGGVFSLKSCPAFELHQPEPAGAPPAPSDFDCGEMMDNQPFGKMLFWELALKAGADCKEKGKCSTLGREGAK